MRLAVSARAAPGTSASANRYVTGLHWGGLLREEVRESSVVVLPCHPASVAEARRRITAELIAAGFFDPVIGDAALVLSELLSNAIRHARPLPGARLQVTCTVSSGCVEVAVSDGGSLTRPWAGQAAASSLGGRGLGIVEHLSRTWGVRSDDHGSTVWAVLPVARQPSAELSPAVR